jgi:hypothetical protein
MGSGRERRVIVTRERGGRDATPLVFTGSIDAF